MTKNELNDIVNTAFDELVRQVSERINSKEKLNASWLKEARQTLLAAKEIARDLPYDAPTPAEGVKHSHVPFPTPSRD